MHMVCDETNSFVQENSLEEDAGLRKKILFLKMTSRQKKLSKEKRSLQLCLKNFLESGELKKISP